MIYEEAGENANVVFGALIDENMKNEISVTVIATGLDMNSVDIPQELEPLPLSAIPEIEIAERDDKKTMSTAPEKEQIKIFEEPKAPSVEKAEIPIFGETIQLDTTIYPLDETQKDNMNVPAYVRKFFKHR